MWKKCDSCVKTSEHHAELMHAKMDCLREDLQQYFSFSTAGLSLSSASRPLTFVRNLCVGRPRRLGLSGGSGGLDARCTTSPLLGRQVAFRPSSISFRRLSNRPTSTRGQVSYKPTAIASFSLLTSIVNNEIKQSNKSIDKLGKIELLPGIELRPYRRLCIPLHHRNP